MSLLKDTEEKLVLKIASFHQLTMLLGSTTLGTVWPNIYSKWEPTDLITINNILTVLDNSKKQLNKSNLLWRIATQPIWCCRTFILPSDSDINTGAWSRNTSLITPSTQEQQEEPQLLPGCQTKLALVLNSAKFSFKILMVTNSSLKIKKISNLSSTTLKCRPRNFSKK